MLTEYIPSYVSSSEFDQFPVVACCLHGAAGEIPDVKSRDRRYHIVRVLHKVQGVHHADLQTSQLKPISLPRTVPEAVVGMVLG